MRESGSGRSQRVGREHDEESSTSTPLPGYCLERRVVSAGRDQETGDHRTPKLELVSVTIPRRVYTAGHLDVVANAAARLFHDHDKISGLRMVCEPSVLRFFTARFEPLAGSLIAD